MFQNLVEPQSKRRGRPCAIERYNNALMEEKLTSLIDPNYTVNDEFTKNNIMPFIIKRKRRQRANVRERNRMQTLNEALNDLKEHLPIDFLLSKFTPDLDNSGSTESGSKKNKKKLHEEKLTKIDTLRMATRYISLLTDMLKDDNEDGNYSESDKTKFLFSSNSSESSSTSPVSGYISYGQNFTPSTELSSTPNSSASSNMDTLNTVYSNYFDNSNQFKNHNNTIYNNNNNLNYQNLSNNYQNQMNYNSNCFNSSNFIISTSNQNIKQTNYQYSNLICSNNFKYF